MTFQSSTENNDAGGRGRGAGPRAACLMLLLLAACGDDVRAPDAGVVDAPHGVCGPSPMRPGFSAAFDGQGNATMSAATYQAAVKYLDDASAWITCAETKL